MRKSILHIILLLLNTVSHLLSSTVLHGNLDFKSLRKLPKSHCGRLASLELYKGCFDSPHEVTMHDYEGCLLYKSEHSEAQWRFNFVLHSTKYSGSPAVSVCQRKLSEYMCHPPRTSHSVTLVLPTLRAEAYPCPALLHHAEHSLSTVFNNRWIRVTPHDFWGWIIKGSMTSPYCFLFQTEHWGAWTRVVLNLLTKAGYDFFDI